MKPSLLGFATLTAMAIMVLLVTYLTIGAAASAQVEWGLGHGAVEAKAEAWATLERSLALLKETWDPTKQSFSLWSQAHPVANLEWGSLSGRVNLNTISPFILGLSPFLQTLKGISVEKFTETRSLKGPSPDGALYQDLIQPAALKAWYTVHSLWNLDTSDEIMLEAMVTQRMGSAAVGSALRASVRSFREQTKRITPSDWARIAGTGASALEPLVTLDPELDVNEISESLLTALMNNPAWAVSEPASKVQILVQGRGVHPWSAERLKTVLAVPDGNLILSYLGVRTRFLGGTVKTSEGSLRFVVFLSGVDPSPVTARITQTTWSAP